MRRNAIACSSLVAAAIILVVLAGLGSRTPTSSALEATVVPANAEYVPPDTHPEGRHPERSMPAQGLQAITPSKTIASGQPAFTADEVVAWVTEHPFPYTTIGEAAPVIESIEFLTAQLANSRLGGVIPVADDTLLCLVTFKGAFSVETGADSGPYRGTTAYWAFDASTGNVLFESVRP